MRPGRVRNIDDRRSDVFDEFAPRAEFSVTRPGQGQARLFMTVLDPTQVALAVIRAFGQFGLAESSLLPKAP
ncbi:hypothetical protein GCM10009539_65070 [Cryptosporangium japonicum]|uniref:Uncharacterized protein n=1 Tax=Cryptosporangium japonicum TaxID=80872 RepID=A0ABN0V098_9ACTN